MRTKQTVTNFAINFDISKRNSRESVVYNLIKDGKYTDEEISIYAKMIFIKHFADFLENNDMSHGEYSSSRKNSKGYSDYEKMTTSSSAKYDNDSYDDDDYDEDTDKNPLSLGGE